MWKKLHKILLSIIIICILLTIFDEMSLQFSAFSSFITIGYKFKLSDSGFMKFLKAYFFLNETVIRELLLKIFIKILLALKIILRFFLTC